MFLNWRFCDAAARMYVLHCCSIWLHFAQTNNLAGRLRTGAVGYYSIQNNYRKDIRSGYCSAIFIFNDLLQLGTLISITGMITAAEAKSDNTTRCSAQAACFITPLQNELCFISSLSPPPPPTPLHLPQSLCNLIYSSGALKDRGTRSPQTRSDNVKTRSSKVETQQLSNS